MTGIRYDPMPNITLDVDHGETFGPEPPLDQAWSDIDKLRWHAGIVLARTGITVQIYVHPDNRDEFGRQGYGWVTQRSSGCCYSFNSMWIWLNGVEDGAMLDRLRHEVGVDHG